MIPSIFGKRASQLEPANLMMHGYKLLFFNTITSNIHIRLVA
ncbi:hypothetical protein B4088_5342 [Bacillus cereus]|uniref:Uncharacterized protein n=1 Tax=Bacillus cereus TaxID=1396 RepID=A0A164LAB7_BACCE|nr:hypothetical protein B4088_5342 [Bacillus cereus]